MGGQQIDGRQRDVTGAVGDEGDRHVPPLVARQVGHLRRQIGEHAGRVASPLRAKGQQARQIAARRPPEIEPRREAAVEEAQPDVAPLQRNLLGQRQRQAAGEDLPRAAHRGAGVDQQVVQPAGAFVLPLVAVIEQIVRERLLLEDVLVVGQLARQERIGVPPPLHRDVAVDGEALGRRAPLGLQQRRQELQREVDHVGRPRRADHPIEIGEIAGAPLGGEEAQQAERSGFDLIEPRQHAALVLEEALQEPQHPGGIVRARQRFAIELVDGRGRGELIGGDAAGDPAQVDVTKQPRQDHRQHLVLERGRRQLGDRVGPRHPRQQRLVARQLRCPLPLAPGAVVPDLPGGAQAPAREHQPEVVDHHQRDPKAQTPEQVPPARRRDGVGRDRRRQLRVGQRRQLAPQLAVARLGVVRHPFRLHGGGRLRRTGCGA